MEAGPKCENTSENFSLMKPASELRMCLEEGGGFAFQPLSSDYGRLGGRQSSDYGRLGGRQRGKGGLSATLNAV